MIKYFDMMYYSFATFYKGFFKKRSGWELQAIFVVTVTQMVLILDLWMIFDKYIYKIEKIDTYAKILFYSVSIVLLYLNIKKYEKKYLHFDKVWGIHNGSKKNLYTFLSFFTVIFSWCFVFILWFLSK